MGRRKGGYRRKTRHLMRKNVRDKGKINLAAYFASYKDGDKVALVAEPGVQDGIYHLRFHGKVGTIVRKQGACYHVAIHDGGKAKTVLVHPVHLQKQGVAGSAKAAVAAKAAARKAPAARPAEKATVTAASAPKPAARAPLKPLQPFTRK